MPATQQSRPRQDPVSCESCRKKKLKCDREAPCANCTTRGVSCEYQGRRPGVSSGSHVDEISALRRQNATILARLESLEQRLSNADHSHTEDRPSKVRRVVPLEPYKALASPATSSSDSPQVAETKTYSNDVKWLEGIGTHENTRLPQLSSPYTVRLAPLQHIVDKANAEDHHERCILLPEEEVGLYFFEAYITQLDPVQHLLHAPTARESVAQLYRKLSRVDHVDANDAILLLTALTSITSYWGLSSIRNSPFDDKQTAINVGVFWLRTALDVLEHVRRSAPASVETVQAAIIMTFLIYHIEGSSPKIRALMATTLTTAKDLGMHRIDDPATSRAEQTQAEVIDKEIKRRIWWHLASTDWSFSLAGGPQEGTYTVNPRHMRVKRPRNVSDEDLATKPADFSRPLSEPTIMGYYLQRIRLNEICRNIADLMWDTDAEHITVEDIRSIDRMFDSMFAELPPFLRVDHADRKTHEEADRTEPSIHVQRYFVNMTVQAKRCKFHMPFLLRAAHDSTFAFCRDACLRSARAIIDIRDRLVGEESGLEWITSSRLVGILHLYFYATMVLVMDYCVHRNAGCELGRKTEIQRACRILEEAKWESGCAGMFLDSITTILRKHQVRLQNAEQVSEYLANDDRSRTTAPVATPTSYITTSPNTNLESDAFDNVNFDELWQNFVDLEATVDPQSWGALLSDIDNLYQGAEH